MSNDLKCQRCGGLKFERGTIIQQSLDWSIVFRPSDCRFLTLKRGASVSAAACLACGALEFSVNLRELSKITKKRVS